MLLVSTDNGNKKVKKPAIRQVNTDLNIDSMNQSLWLVKIPQFVAEKWTHERSGEIVGSLQVVMQAAQPGKPASKQLNVKLNAEQHSDIPHDFTLEEVKSTSNTDSFVALSLHENSSFSLDGKVTKNLLLKPQGTKEYRHMIRARGMEKITSRRETQVADTVNVQRAQNQSHTVEFITSERSEMKRKNIERYSGANKIGKLDGETNMLRSKMFESFEKNDKQTFKEIAAYCRDVPGFTNEKDLRDLLEVYAKYTSRGAFKHLWELKSEFKDHTIVEGEIP